MYPLCMTQLSTYFLTTSWPKTPLSLLVLTVHVHTSRTIPRIPILPHNSIYKSEVSACLFHPQAKSPLLHSYFYLLQQLSISSELYTTKYSCRDKENVGIDLHSRKWMSTCRSCCFGTVEKVKKNWCTNAY